MTIEDLGNGQFRARVIDSPTGQASGEFELPFSDMELENFLLKIGRPRSGVRRIESPENEAARQFGSRLYDAVFAGDVGTQWMRSIDSVEREACGLRLRLRLSDAPALADLPWEYLYSPATDDFVVLSSWTPMVRYISLDKGAPPLQVAPPLRILAMVSSPTDYPPLDVEAEWARLDDGLGDLIREGMVEIHRMDRATLRELQRTLRRQDFHLFHFIGHGGFDAAADDGVLLLETEDGRAREVTGRQLGTILDDARTIRVAVLNACEGARASGTDPFAGVAQSLVARGIPAVVAMQFEITDRAAIVFAHEFYASIADGMAVEGAVGEARRAIFGTKSDVEWGTAVLYMRAEDGRLFDLTESPPGAKPPIVTAPVVADEPAEAVVEEIIAETSVTEPVTEESVAPIGETVIEELPAPVVEPVEAVDPKDVAPLSVEPVAATVAEAEDGVATTAVPDRQPRQESTAEPGAVRASGVDVVDRVGDYAKGFSRTVGWVIGGVIAVVFLIGMVSGALNRGDGGGDTTIPGTTGEVVGSTVTSVPEGVTTLPPLVAPEILNSPTVTLVVVTGVSVDGDLGDWAAVATAYELNHPVQDGLVENRLGSDSIGTLWVAYDSEAMYVAVAVADDVYSQENEGNQIWRGDAIDINLFAGPSGDVPARPDSRTFQLTMAPQTTAGGPGLVLFTGNGSQFSDNTTNLPIDLRGAVDAGGDWRLEARIPWSVFGIDGPSSLSSALFAVFDNDGEVANGRSLQAEILTNLEGVFFQQPQTWGSLVRE